MSICSHCYPAYNAHAYYYIVIRDLSDPYHIFPHYFTNTQFSGKLLDIKCVFWLSLQLFAKTFLILRRMSRAFIINVVHRSLRKALLYSRVILMKLEFS
jgi:hypothetical protein